MLGDRLLGVLDGRLQQRSSRAARHLADPTLQCRTCGTEHEVLTADLGRHLSGRLRDLQETAERHDVTYLANKSGWDARAVALAALADEFAGRSDEAQQSIPAPLFYALFRAGVPADRVRGLPPRCDGRRVGLERGHRRGDHPGADLAAAVPDRSRSFRALQRAHCSPVPPGRSLVLAVDCSRSRSPDADDAQARGVCPSQGGPPRTPPTTSGPPSRPASAVRPPSACASTGS